MDDLAGILTLLALVVLSVPILLVMALVKIGNAKARIDTLEREVQQLQRRLLGVEARAPGPATFATAAKVVDAPADAPADTFRPQAAAAPTPPFRATAPDAGARDDASAATSPGRARFDLPDEGRPVEDVPPPVADPSSASTAVPASGTAMPPPLPPRRTAPSEPVPPPRPPRPDRPPLRPPSDPIGDAFGVVRRWFTEGNVPVKIGMLVLLAGVAALLKYANDQGWVRVPMELRLAGIAAAAIGGLVFAWRQRETRRSFSLSLQGGAIGVLMLVTFAAFKLYGMIPAGAAFGITIALVAGLGVLAVMQNARALAIFGILAGFLAPIWLSTGSGNHVALFSYYAVLNLGIFGIAWHRAWRLLNLLGFVFTFGIGTLWGVLDYQPEKFASTEPFLLLFFALYLLIPVFYANRRGEDPDGNAHRLVDGTLVFGTPLVAFALQAGLLQGERMPLALSALGAAAIYALLAALLRGRERFASLVDTYAVLAVGFSTLAVPLALSARATASVFALEGAALVWLGVRQGRQLPQVAGLLLQLAAAAAYVAGVGGLSTGFSAMAAATAATPIANPAFMSALLIAIAGFATAWTYRREQDAGIVALLALWALGWWTFAGVHEIFEHVAYPERFDALFAFVVFTGWLSAEVRRRFDDLAVFGVVAAVALALGVPLTMAQSGAHNASPLTDTTSAAAWIAFAVLGWRSLLCLREAGTVVRLIGHGGWLWAWATMVAISALDFADSAELGQGWQYVALVFAPLLLATLLQLRPSALAPPMREGFGDYRPALLASAWLALGLVGGVSLFLAGDSAPLPWISLLNPLELFQLAILALLAQWVWSGDGLGRRIGVPAFAFAAFLWITFATLRATHQWGGAPWSPRMLDDSSVQTALTVVWSVLGVLGWIFGSRRGERLLWGAGAVLMAVVLLKLLLIDRSHLGNLFGIVSFIAYGLLCTAVGYFAPAPPRRAATETAT
jgi:uncharacterized membrane protein